MNAPFWKFKSFVEMSRAEWESLCDGCGHCCLIKLEDEDTHEVYVTNVACRLLDIESCRCNDYHHRQEKVSTCLMLKPESTDLFKLLPETCAYRRLSEGKELEDWHPLVSKNPDLIHEQSISVKEFAQSEEHVHVDQLPEHVMDKLL